jgi:hypothetical protein
VTTVQSGHHTAIIRGGGSVMLASIERAFESGQSGGSMLP